MMKRNRKVNLVSLLLPVLFLKCLTLSAQETYKYRAGIQKIDSSGVYKIELGSGFLSLSKSKELYDLRVIDEAGKFTAYAIVTNPSDKVKPAYVDFPEVKQDSHPDSITVYIAENNHKYKVSQLWLKLRNTDVNRLVNISGSDDLQHWFAIKEGIQLQDANSAGNPEYEQMLNFPTSDNRYFKIQISNKNKDLIQIIRSGIYVSDEVQKDAFAILPPVKIRSRNADKATSYYVNLTDDDYVDQLKLDIASPKYYNRHILIYDISHKAEELLYEDSISSSVKKEISISTKTNRLRVDIINGDDSPLIIKDITALQKPRFAVSYLEKGHTYYILTGDTNAKEVSYDLSFLHSLPLTKFPVISDLIIEKNPAYKTKQPVAKHNFTVLLWVAIILVLLLLSILTWKMIAEINAKQNTSE